MYASPGFGRGQPAYLYWSTALSLLFSGQSGCLTHVPASISAFPSVPGFADLTCSLSLNISPTALYVSILLVSPEAIFPYHVPRGSSCIQISMRCPLATVGHWAGVCQKESTTCWHQGRPSGYWACTGGQHPGSPMEIFFWWKYRSGAVGTGMPLKTVPGSLLYTGYLGHHVEDCLVLALHSEQPDCGHTGTGCSLMSAFSGPLGTYWS